MAQPTEQQKKLMERFLDNYRELLLVGEAIRKTWGLSKSTYYLWLKQYPKFKEQVEDVWAEDIVTELEDLEYLSARDNVQSRQWLLGRLYPQKYGRFGWDRTRVDTMKEAVARDLAEFEEYHGGSND